MTDGNAEFETGLTLSGTLDVSKITGNNSGITRLSVAEAWIKGDKILRKKCLKFGIAILFIVLIVLIVLVIQKVNRVSNSGPYYVSECNVVDKSQQHNSCYSKKIDKNKYRYAYTINSDYCQSNGISYSMVWFQYCQHKDIRLNIGDTKKCWINKCSTEDALLTFENPILKYYLPVGIYLVLSIICVGFMIRLGYKHCKISLNDDDGVDSLEDVPLDDIKINDDIGNRSPGSSIAGRNGGSTPSIVGRNGIKRIIKSDNFIALENNSDSDDATLGVLLSVDSDDIQGMLTTSILILILCVYECT